MTAGLEVGSGIVTFLNLGNAEIERQKAVQGNAILFNEIDQESHSTGPPFRYWLLVGTRGCHMSQVRFVCPSDRSSKPVIPGSIWSAAVTLLFACYSAPYSISITVVRAD